MTNNDAEKNRDFFDALCEFVYGSQEEYENRPLDQIEDDLREAGIDAATVVSTIQFAIKKKTAQMKLESARQLKSNLVQTLMKKVLEASKQFPEQRDALIEKAKEIFGGQPQVAFRSYEDATTDDLKGLIEDLEKLGMWDKLDENGQ